MRIRHPGDFIGWAIGLHHSRPVAVNCREVGRTVGAARLHPSGRGDASAPGVYAPLKGRTRGGGTYHNVLIASLSEAKEGIRQMAIRAHYDNVSGRVGWGGFRPVGVWH